MIMKQYRPIALCLALLLVAAFIFSCTGNDEKDPSAPVTTLTNENGEIIDSEGNVVGDPLDDPIIVGDVSFTLPHVPQDIPIGTTTTTTRRPSTPSNPKPDNPNPPTPDVPAQPPRDEDPEAPADTPVTGADFDEWFGARETVSVLGASAAGFTFWGDGALEHLYDGRDGYTSAEEWTKMGGGAQRGSFVILEVEPDTEVTAYALITANDSATYERTPGSWRVYATNTDPESAGEDDWTVIDYVYDGGTRHADFTPFGYTIDEDKSGEYRYYKFEFLYGVEENLAAIQLCELWLLK